MGRSRCQNSRQSVLGLLRAKTQGKRGSRSAELAGSFVCLFCLLRMTLLMKTKDKTGDSRLQQSEQTSGNRAALGVTDSGMPQSGRTQPSSNLLCPACFRIFRSSQNSSGVKREISSRHEAAGGTRRGPFSGPLAKTYLSPLYPKLCGCCPTPMAGQCH